MSFGSFGMHYGKLISTQKIEEEKKERCVYDFRLWRERERQKKMLLFTYADEKKKKGKH